MPDRRGRSAGGTRHYQRKLRVDVLLRRVLAEQLERLADEDPRLGILTVTNVDAEPDLHHATVYLATLPALVAEALGEHRKALQAAIASEVRLKRTPLLAFAADPAIASGQKVEDILRALRAEEERGEGAGDGDEHG